MHIGLLEPGALPQRSASGIAGHFQPSIESFHVEEIPAYPPSGEGEHLFVWVQKRGLTTQELTRRWQKAFSLKPADIGAAGLKDRHATTRQWISLRGVAAEALEAFEDPGVEVLEASLHTNKLRTGHLRGNRFCMKLPLEQLQWDGEQAQLQQRFEALGEELRQLGMPNFYGPQRFGREGNTHLLGRELLLGKRKAKGKHRRLLISAYQSSLFNDLLARRMEDGLLERALEGDIMQLHESGGRFVCEHPHLEQPRVDALEISPTGWMPGYRSPRASGLAGEWEEAILEREQIQPEMFRALGKIAQGTRRPMRVPVGALSVAWSEAEVELRFCLPPGSYASVLLAQFGIHFARGF